MSLRKIYTKKPKQCDRCSLDYYGGAKSKYCIDCKVDIMEEHSREQNRKRRDRVRERKLIMKGL